MTTTPETTASRATINEVLERSAATITEYTRVLLRAALGAGGRPLVEQVEAALACCAVESA